MNHYMLEVGAVAPSVNLPDKDGRIVSLNDFKGQKIILYFYSKDNTSGCSRQASAFAALYEQFKAINSEVIGISKDSVASHKKFAEKNSLPFILLSDVEKKALSDYGVLKEKKNYGKTSIGVVRTTFIIDENGNLEKVFKNVKPDNNAADVLAYLQQSLA